MRGTTVGRCPFTLKYGAPSSSREQCSSAPGNKSCISFILPIAVGHLQPHRHNGFSQIQVNTCLSCSNIRHVKSEKTLDRANVSKRHSNLQEQIRVMNESNPTHPSLKLKSWSVLFCYVFGPCGELFCAS